MPSVDVTALITGLNPVRQTSSYRMPVLSPRHTSSTTITGSYRSTFSSSSIDRPYYASSNSYVSVSPRINTYSERFSSRTYSTDDGKKVYSRHASIAEDGITSRFREREETREKSTRRDSLSRESGYRDSSTRSNSLRDSSLIRDRDISLTRSNNDTPSRNSISSTMSIIETVADLRNKYSPANYVPAVLRKQENISRSKSINDIGGRPEMASSTMASSGMAGTGMAKNSMVRMRKVIENGVNCNGVALTNTTNDKLDNTVTVAVSNDSNGNRASVAEIRKKFDSHGLGLFVEGTGLGRSRAPKASIHSIPEPNLPNSNGITLTTTIHAAAADNNQSKECSVQTNNSNNGGVRTTNEALSDKRTQNNKQIEIDTTSTTSNTETLLLAGGAKFYSRPAKCFKINDLEIQEGENEVVKASSDGTSITFASESSCNSNSSSSSSSSSSTSTKSTDNSDNDGSSSSLSLDGTDASRPPPHNHTSNFASYIPSKDFIQQQNDTNTNTNNIDADVPMNQTEDLDMDNNENSATHFSYQHRILNSNNDISTSPRLTRSAALNQKASSSHQSSSAAAVNNIASTKHQRSSPAIERNNRDERDERSASISKSNSYDRQFVGTGAHSNPPIRNQGLNGLKNIGNTCFMNSVIQCLSNTRYLLEYVKEDDYLDDINTSISSMKGALIKAFSQVIQELWSPDSSDRIINTVSLKSQIQRFTPRFMGYSQQDAQEFLRYLLEGLHEDVNRVTSKPTPILTEIDEKLSDGQKASESWQRYLRMDNSRVVDIFVGQLKSTLRCTHCGHCSVTFDPFWDLSLPIPQRQGPLRLAQCLDHFTREETLDGDEKPTCSKCKERRKCTKSFSIQKFPKILVIHLKRFSPTERFRGKLNIVIDFPLQGLDMSPYAANKGHSSECMYNLYAISNHSGTTYSGHYTAYCKHPYSGQWHEYNDSRVSSISPKNVVSSEAYVLFYELIGHL